MDLIPIVLCAGFGTRLRPLTHYVPKPVVPVGEIPVAYHSIKQLLEAGADIVHCNTHFLPNIVEEELRKALEEDGYKQNRIRFWHEPEILETGGGIARIVHELRNENAQKWYGRDVLAIAGDVFANPPLTTMMERWQNRSHDTCALMTTRTLQAPRPDVTWVDNTKNEVVGFGKDITESAPHLETRVFSTHQIIRHDWVAQAPIVKESSRDIFYRAGLKKGLRILNVNFPDENAWFDIGDYASLAACAATLAPLGREPVRCLTLSQADQITHQSCLINTHLITGVINRLRSSFVLPSGESLSSRVMSLVHQSNCLSKSETRLLTVAPGEPRLVLCAEACPVDLPFPLLLSLEDLEGSSSSDSVQSSSTLFLFPTKTTAQA
jgi:choline kinase